MAGMQGSDEQDRRRTGEETMNGVALFLLGFLAGLFVLAIPLARAIVVLRMYDREFAKLGDILISKGDKECK